MTLEHPDAPDPDADADLGPLADAFRALQPVQLDPARRAAILRTASRSARSQRSQFARLGWPALAASLGLVALVEGALLARRPATVVVERVVVVHEPAPTLVPPAPTLAGRPPATTPDSPPSFPLERDPRLGSIALDRLAARPMTEVAPRLPGPTGPELRRALFRLALSPPGGSS